ncbi:MAG: hypothetical protein FWF03_01030 [Defluviitaleaceae bacterium]|nr:hypothetical protein [Defluviitaleaceae bacterium]
MDEPICGALQKPESYEPKKPEIIGMAKESAKNIRGLFPPDEFLIKPKHKIAGFSGDGWPFSNVEPAVYGALGLLYGRTALRGADGALVNGDMEYSIQNVLTGHAFGLFYCLPDDGASLAAYGLSCCLIGTEGLCTGEIINKITESVAQGCAVHIDEGCGKYDYLVWGYRPGRSNCELRPNLELLGHATGEGGNVLLGHTFEHGNDTLNCSCDFENPSEITRPSEIFADSRLFRPNGERPGGVFIISPDGPRLNREFLYQKALAEGFRMMTQTAPPVCMDMERVHFGYGQAVYDEWERQIERAQAENYENYFYVSPIFPHFIALYENRLHLHKFLKMLAERTRDKNLAEAAETCGLLRETAQGAAVATMEGDYNPLRSAANYEKRAFLLESLQKCRGLELKTAEQIGEYLRCAEGYSPKKPEIVALAKNAQNKFDYPESFVLPSGCAEIPEGVRHAGPAYVGFANEFAYFMDYTNQGYGFVYHGDWRKSKDYALFDALTGYAARPAAHIKPTDAELLTAYGAAGFYPEIFSADPDCENYLCEADMADAIKYALCALKQPAILPQAELFCGSIVVGYKNYGRTLIFYSLYPYFMRMEDNTEPRVEEVSGWYHGKAKLMIVGERANSVSELDISKAALRKLHESFSYGLHGGGKRHYDEWINFLRLSKNGMIGEVLKKRFIPGGSVGRLTEAEANERDIWDVICMAQDTVWCEIAEARFYIARLMYQIKELFPDCAEDLQTIGDHFCHASDIMGNERTGYGSEIGDPCDREIFSKNDVRERMAGRVADLMAADEKGLGLIEGLLKRMNL